MDGQLPDFFTGNCDLLTQQVRQQGSSSTAPARLNSRLLCNRPGACLHTPWCLLQFQTCLAMLWLQGRAVVFDYFDDPALQRQGRMDMLQLRT